MWVQGLQARVSARGASGAPSVSKGEGKGEGLALRGLWLLLRSKVAGGRGWVVVHRGHIRGEVGWHRSVGSVAEVGADKLREIKGLLVIHIRRHRHRHWQGGRHSISVYV